MNKERWNYQEIERRLGQEPTIRDDDFSRRVQAAIARQHRQRRLVFLGVSALWLMLFLAMTPALPLQSYLDRLRLIGSRAGAMIPAQLDLQVIDLLSQPGIQLGIGFLLASCVALVTSQLGDH